MHMLFPQKKDPQAQLSDEHLDLFLRKFLDQVKKAHPQLTKGFSDEELKTLLEEIVTFKGGRLNYSDLSDNKSLLHLSLSFVIALTFKQKERNQHVFSFENEKELNQFINKLIVNLKGLKVLDDKDAKKYEDQMNERLMKPDKYEYLFGLSNSKIPGSIPVAVSVFLGNALGIPDNSPWNGSAPIERANDPFDGFVDSRTEANLLSIGSVFVEQFEHDLSCEECLKINNAKENDETFENKKRMQPP